MKHRCSNPNHPSTKDYLGRGIGFDETWERYEAFRDWAYRNGYKNGLSLDRIDNDKGYSPENCRWVTSKRQCRNRRSNTILTAFGESKSMADWAEDQRCIVGYETLMSRIKFKWDHHRALTTPLARQRQVDDRERLHRVWGSMVQRCTNPKDRAAKNYYSRGIRVCPDWTGRFAPFYEWAIANGYRRGLSLERIDVDGDYSPKNCRWATRTEQARNKQRHVMLTAFGETKVAADWADDPRCVTSHLLLLSRIRKGWDHELAITKPVGRWKIKTTT